MYTRVLTFDGATNIDGGVDYLRDQVLPILNSQHGYRGITASGDRKGALLGIMSLWDTEADRAASDSALGKARQEAAQIVGGKLTVENFEQVVQEISKPPVAGCALMVTRLSMDPAVIDENLEFFKNEAVPQIKAQPGFCGLRNMVDRTTGKGVVGSVWDDQAALGAYAANSSVRRAPAVERGISFGGDSFREILFTDVK
jgi:heme-degrading monooxygenase HmoA